MTALRLEFLHPDGSSVIAYNLAVQDVPRPRRAPHAGVWRRFDRSGRAGYALG